MLRLENLPKAIAGISVSTGDSKLNTYAGAQPHAIFDDQLCQAVYANVEAQGEFWMKSTEICSYCLGMSQHHNTRGPSAKDMPVATLLLYQMLL